MRKLLVWTLFATAAAVPVMASAQDNDGRGERRARVENRGGDSAQPDRFRRQERAPVSDSSNDARQQRREYRESRAATAPAPDVRQDGRDRANRDWSRRADRTPPQVQPATGPVPVQDNGPRGWGRDNNGQRDWNHNDNDRRNDARRDANRNDNGGRDWRRDNDGRRDWNRNDNARRDWDRNNDGRRDWNGNSGWRGNDRNARNWDRGWRNNNRYDWQRYRSSNRYAFRLPRYNAPYNWSYGYRRQSIGAYLFAGLFAQDYWINDPWEYRLPPTYWPYQWVRYYDDALLVDTRTGYVVDEIPGIFWY